jgi:hypothetical protein
MASLKWADVLDQLLQSGDDPRAVAARFSREADQREREADALRSLALAIRELAPAPIPTEESPEIPPTGGLPDSRIWIPRKSSLVDTIRAVMRTGGVWTPKDLLGELEKRDATPRSKTPIRSVEAAVNRLWREQGEIERVGRGEYVWAEGPPASPSLEDLSAHADSIGTSIEALKKLHASESEAKD